MSQTASLKSRNTIPHEELQAWIHGEPPFDEDCRQLLTAYRRALLAANDQGNWQEPSERPTAESSAPKPYRPRVSAVPRLTDVEGLGPAQLARSHGRLIAIGLLREDLDGTSGLTYRLTGEAVGRLEMANQ